MKTDLSGVSAFIFWKAFEKKEKGRCEFICFKYG